MYPKWHIRSSYLAAVLAALLIIAMLAVIGFTAVYAGKIYPGVSVDGIYVGGMSAQDAKDLIKKNADQYQSQQIPVQYGQTTLNVPVRAIGVQYGDEGVDAALKFGRRGSFATQIRARLRSLVGRSADFSNYTYDDSKLTPFLAQADDDVTQPVANASLSFENGQTTVTPSQPGYRLDRGLLAEAIEDQLAHMSNDSVPAAVYQVTPTIDVDALSHARHQADRFVAGPITLETTGLTQTVDQQQILGWIDIATVSSQTELPLDPLKSFYPYLNAPSVTLKLDSDKVNAFVGDLAAKINRDASNAVLAMQDGKLTVVQPSQNGLSLDQTEAAKLIAAAVDRPADQRDIKLPAKSTEAEVNEKNLDSLGIKELISEGQTFFPGSPATRLINVRTGASKFDGILLKPGEVFSFGRYLGDVGPAQGYVPELVILGDHEEKQYGGGLCQVSSTAYRAALLAGLPIVERHNHSFAVSYYTAPYGVPGVDATIYYPQVDFKFKNDTGSYILIQTHMEGTTLTFDYFGTKTKTGEIRGPQFVSGSNDATQPSHTVFWRDVKDLSGNVIKTDQIDTYYESSKNFPITKQFN